MKQYWNKLVNLDESVAYKPLFQRLSTWIIVGISLLVLFVLWSFALGVSWTIFSWKTDTGSFYCEEQYVKVEVDVYKWTTVREYNRSSVPSCAWDEDYDWYTVCDSKDEDGNCTSSHIEEEYDFSVRKWKFYKTIKVNLQSLDSLDLRDYKDPQYDIKKTTVYYYGKFTGPKGEPNWVYSLTPYVVGNHYDLLFYVKAQTLKSWQG